MKVKKSFKIKKFLLILSLFISIVFLSAVGVVCYYFGKYHLDINKLTSVNNGIRVYSSSGTDTTLYNTNRSIVEIETLPDYVINAFVDTEDKRFYEHNGYDIKRLIKAAFVDFTTKSKSQGASTVSQQLIKNTLLTNEKTFSRKIKELVLAIKMEKEFSKDEILEMYLNTIYFGSNSYGIENASKSYFNKSAKDLTINEACCLAGIIKSPGYYSPRINYNNAINRKNLVAKNMLSSGNLSNEEYEKVINSQIDLASQSVNDHSYEKEAIFEACSLLNISERELINRNYEIITHKDDSLQKHIQKTHNLVLDSNIDSMSIVANSFGEIISYYVNSNYDLHNMRRQPASILKPLAVYLPCLQHNILNTESLLLDEEINYSGFSPQNADDKFHGWVSMKNSLAQSLNVPAVKCLDYVGLKKSKETLNSLGINLPQSDLNLSLALGSTKNGIKPIELLSAYNTIANLGTYRPLTFINKILDENGNIIYSKDEYFEKIIDSESCFLLTDMMKESALSGTAKRLDSLNIPIASKTGTAAVDSNNTDLYNVSYTTEHSMLTWIADLDNKYLDSKFHSSTHPTEINKQICEKLYFATKPKDFEIPSGVQFCPFDLIELNNNKRFIAPNGIDERYVGYGYFKTENAPIEIQKDDKIAFSVLLDKTGAKITFNAKKSSVYKLFKIANGNCELFKEIKETNGNVEIIDSSIFAFNQIIYRIENEQGASFEQEIRPKDYLIGMLNNEIISKKKWYV